MKGGIKLDKSEEERERREIGREEEGTEMAERGRMSLDFNA